MRALFRTAFAVQLLVVVSASVAAYTGLIPTSVGGLPGFDKVGHFIMIGLLGALLDGALDRRSARLGRVEVPLGPLLILAIAAVEEYLQRCSPRRDSSIYDYLADLSGVILLTFAARRLAELPARGRSRHVALDDGP